MAPTKIVGVRLSHQRTCVTALVLSSPLLIAIQYCSNVYTQILKDEFYLDQTFDSVAHAKESCKKCN